MELATLILYWLLGTALYAADAAVPVTTTISISGGLLIKNGKQTSCEIVPIGNSAVFVAANCLDYANDLTLNTDTEYKIALQVYKNARAPVVSVDKNNINVHPDYNATTLVNNIAVIILHQLDNETIQTNIAYQPAKFSPIQYKRLVLGKDMNGWNRTTSAVVNTTNPACNNNPLFRDNEQVFLCNVLSVDIKIDQTKHQNIAFGSGDIYVGNTHHFYSLYSHSVIDSVDLKQAKSVVSVYMIVSNYIYFANDILQTQIYYYDQAENSSNVPLPSYIVEPGKAVDAGIVIGGDLYAVEDREAEAATASDEDASVDTQTPPVLTTHSAINSDNPELNSANDENNSRSGLSTGAIVGIAIGVSVLVIILLVFVVRWVLIATKKQREEKYWDNEMENMKSAMSLGQHGQAEPA